VLTGVDHGVGYGDRRRELPPHTESHDLSNPSRRNRHSEDEVSCLY
jgi:hypothetical protein